MNAALKSTWPLLFGIALIMVANGMQASLLGVRAGQEGFSTLLTGLVMSGYFIGFLFGSVMVPKLVEGVGHVRVFAALASLASVAVLIHAVVVEPWTWTAMRVVTGLASAGLYIVAESWLNDKATNETRGQLLGLYMIVVLVAMGAGQFLLNLADTRGFVLFVVASVLVSLALIPILLTASQAPDFAAPKRIGLAQLYRTSPLAVVACAGVGLGQSTLWGLAAVYAESSGFTIAQITLYTSAIFLGGVIFQWPLGRLSDKLDRRSVLAAMMLAAGVYGLISGIAGTDNFGTDVVAILVIGGLLMPSYSVVVAYMNDRLEPAQMVAASAGLYFIYGLGASVGPFAAAGVMTLLGPDGYYLSLGSVASLVGLFALYRMARRPAMPLAEQGPSVALAGQTSPLATELAAEVCAEEADQQSAG